MESQIILLTAIIWFYMKTASIAPFHMPLSSWTDPMHGYSRYSPPTMSLPTIFLPLWMRGRKGLRISCRGRLRVLRYSSHAWFHDKSTSISTRTDSLIPASKISNLTQGMFVGAVSDNFDERIDQKIFHAEIGEGVLLPTTTSPDGAESSITPD